MGTSQPNPSPNDRSPLVPPWADDEPEKPLPEPEPRRFKEFRQYLGKFAAGKNTSDLRKALGFYSRKATGGRTVASRRLSTVSNAGALLFGIMSGNMPDIPDQEQIVDLNELSGLPCEVVIKQIVEVVTPENGDADKIRIAMNTALSEALDGIEAFDTDSITDTVLIDTMIAYLSESIFLQIVQDSGKAWTKAESPSQMIDAENALHELIKVEVDKHMLPLFSTGIRSLSTNQMNSIQRQTIQEIWREWEGYL